ncbi:MAG: DUF2268 domain-containing putative Zn-dependent protease [Pseudomonadota bacterium]
MVFDDGGALGAQAALIRDLIEDTVDQANATLPVEQSKFTVRSDASRTVPGYGIAGFALDINDIEIVVDPLFPGLEQALRERLPYVVAHELHHIVRLRDPGIYQTLFDALIFEGMADHYARDLTGAGLAPWSDAFPEADTDQYLVRAEPLFDSGFDFQAWFFGQGTDLPVWTGYTLGYRILRDYYDARPDLSAADTVNAPADDFRPGQTL